MTVRAKAHRLRPTTVAAMLVLVASLPLPGVDLVSPAAAVRKSAAVELPVFQSSITRIGPNQAGRMSPSWRAGCPVGLAQLRLLQVTYHGFDGAAHTGRIVVHERWAEPVVDVFRTAYDARFPIRRMRLVDRYQGSDARSMAANNTSGFNCRLAQGSDHWSRHAYGAAIDVNPVQNPYVQGPTVLPAAGEDFVERTPRRKGMVTREVRQAFADIGWSWGGDFVTIADYQHFSAAGG
ncbi:M15 family metallopeptidase [soil metagenome]|jgi:hypothetical protein